jgi:hypothetical protein
MIEVAGVLVILSALLRGGYSLAVVFGQWWTFLDVAWHILSTIDLVGYGLAAVGLGQLLRYVLGEKQHQGCFLRLADKWLLIWAGVTVLDGFADPNLFRYPWATGAAPFIIVFPIAQSLVLVSIALILRRALPIVEESRALV